MDERFPKSARLLKRAEFRRTYDLGKAVRNSGFHLFVRPRPDGGDTRLGLTATRAAGGSVVRNRLRRWAREAFRRWRPQVVPGQDVVANLHRRLAAMPHAEFDRLFRDALAKAHLLESGQAVR